MTAGPGRHLVTVAVFVLCSVACGLISLKLGAYDSWDLRNYQFYSPYALLHQRFGFDQGVAQIQTFLNPAPFVPFYLLTTQLAPKVAGFCLGMLHGLSVGFVFLIAMKILAPATGAGRTLLAVGCTAAGAWGPTFLPLLGGSGSDHVVSIFVLAGLYLLVTAADASSRRRLVGAALLIGVAAGLKLTALVFCLGGVGAVLAAYGRRSGGLRASVWFGGVALAGILVSRGAWMVHLWSSYGSPFFPFFNGWLKSPWYHPENFADDRFLPGSWGAALLFPFRFFTQNEFTMLSHQFRDLRYPLLYALLLLVAGVMVWRRARPGRGPSSRLDARARALLAFVVVSYVVWQMKFAIMRYIVPIELVAPLAMVILVRELFGPGRIRGTATIALLVVVVIAMHPRTVHRTGWGPKYLEVVAPRFEEPASVMVVIADDRPWSYLVPFFQPEVRFLGLANRFSRDLEGEQHLAKKRMFELMDEHQGEIYLLSPGSKIAAARARLGRYTTIPRLRNRPGVESAHEKESLYLWRLRLK